MDITINGKKFIFNDDVRLGVLMQLQKDPESMDTLFLFFKEVLVPSPTTKELDNFRQSDMERIFEKWGVLQNEKIIETKKKLSL